MIALLKAGHHLAVNFIDTASTNAVMGMVLHECLPGISEQMMRVFPAKDMGQGG
ncbi:hypothetical protein D3C81_1289440 [compost metagenome]